GVVDAGRDLASLAQGLGGIEEEAVGADDHGVGCAEVLAGPVGDRAHRLLGHRVLEGAGDAGEVAGLGFRAIALDVLLLVAVDEEVVVKAVCGDEAADPVAGPGQLAAAAAELALQLLIVFSQLVASEIVAAAEGDTADAGGIRVVLLGWETDVPDHRVLVVDWHPDGVANAVGEGAGGGLGVEGDEEVADTPVVLGVGGGPGGAISGADRVFDDHRFEVPDLHGEVVRAVGHAVFGADVAGVEEAEVDRIDVAFDRLHEVAVLDELADSAA